MYSLLELVEGPVGALVDGLLGAGEVKSLDTTGGLDVSKQVTTGGVTQGRGASIALGCGGGVLTPRVRAATLALGAERARSEKLRAALGAAEREATRRALAEVRAMDIVRERVVRVVVLVVGKKEETRCDGCPPF
jgi:hypothetical protein